MATVDGGGVRYNAGKAPFDMLPLALILKVFGIGVGSDSDAADPARKILYYMGQWQAGDDSALDCALGCAMSAPGLAGFAEGAHVFQHVTTRPVKPYPKWNWMRGMAWSIPLGCIVRHCLAWLDGQENDPETGLPHQGHIQCNLVMLKYYSEHYPQGDDRPKAASSKPETAIAMVCDSGYSCQRPECGQRGCARRRGRLTPADTGDD